jgi:acyl carrier protein
MGERLIAIVAAALRVPTSKLTLETGPGDLEAWDSLAQINIVSEIEAEFGASIPIERWQRSDTSATFWTTLRRHHEMCTRLER